MRLALIPLAALGLVFGGACSSDPEPAGGVVTTTTVAAVTSSTMSFAECQKSGEYPGGRYAVDYNNGVCTVQKPTATTAAPVSYANCDAVRAAGKAPLVKGEPGYSTSLDRDGDGVACDTAP